MSVTIGTVLKKVIAILLGNKRGRKFLGYVIGIVLFLLLLPVVVVYGLFGGMSGSASIAITPEMIYAQMPAEHYEQLAQYDGALQMIQTAFRDRNIPKENMRIAEIIFLSCLTENVVDLDFCTLYADCFENATDVAGMLENISSTFGIEFSEADITKLETLANESFGDL